ARPRHRGGLHDRAPDPPPAVEDDSARSRRDAGAGVQSPHDPDPSRRLLSGLTGIEPRATGAMSDKLSAQQRSKIRRMSRPKEHGPDDAGGELNIVPFLDIITNVLMFVLATITVTFTATIDTYPPRAGSGARAPITPTLGLTILVVPDGFSLKARGGNVAPGCSDTGPGIAIPKKDAEYDFVALKACAAKLKGAAPEFKEE